MTKRAPSGAKARAPARGPRNDEPCQACEENDKERPGWGPGPWQDEPNRAEFEHSGLHCIVHRGMAWCGYVGVPPGHPAYQKDYEEIDIDVHGGLTFGAMCHGHICHIPKPGDPEELYWLGFDCAHAGDLVFGRNLARTILEGSVGLGHYWTMDETIEETKHLAEQLAATGPNPKIGQRGESQ